MKSQIIKRPGYYKNKPTFKAIAKIKRVIGLQDICIQTNQVAILFLEEKAKLAKNEKEFIQNLCSRYKISRGTHNFDEFKKSLYQSYILQTYNLIEPLLIDLNKTYRYYNNFKGVWKVKSNDKNIDPLNQLLENIAPELKRKIKSYPEYYLLNYYRLVRNSIVHLQINEKKYQKSIAYYTNYLDKRISHFKENYDIEAPNLPEQITFEDFMLYTRAIKYFGNILNDVCFPKINTIIQFAKNNEKLQKKLRQTKSINNQGELLRRINTLRSFFHEHFNTAHKILRDEFCNDYLNDEGRDGSQYLD